MMSSTENKIEPDFESVVAHGSETVAIPYYISGHYRCAYLWPPGVWFFDHMPIINCIVFGQYTNMVDATLEHITADDQTGETLLIASALGNLVPRLARKLGPNRLTIIDVAPIQLELAETKLAREDLLGTVELRQMDAEALEFDDNSFDTAVMFLLLNEMPPGSRERALEHALRVIRPGGQLIVTEYGDLTGNHWIHRLAPLRWLVTRVEPWLDSLWRQDLSALVERCAQAQNKSVTQEQKTQIFSGFYRVHRFRIGD